MLLRVLGPLELVGEAGAIPLRAAKVRTLLAVLAVQRPAVCGTDALIDALWGETAPASAAKLVQVYVSQLRRELPPGLEITTEPSGYALAANSASVDASEFERLAAEGQDALRIGNVALAASILRRALGLWRGPAYADVQYESFAREEIERLETIRRMALADRIDADLRLGRHADVVGETRGLVTGDPTDERLVELAMIAAYRAEGTAAALRLFDAVRDELRADLGAEPSPTLIELRDRIARQDPSLAAPAAQADSPPLPIPPNALIGRKRELAELTSLLGYRTVRLVSLTGAGGSGKSRIALELARAVGPDFANGAVLVELASLRDPDLVPSTIAHAVGIDPGGDAAASLVEGLRDRELLLVLDNLEHLRAAAPGVVQLIASAPRLIVVVTSRVLLHVSGEHVYPIGPLSESEAVALFEQRARALDPSFSVDVETAPVAASICRRLDSLPLPIELAAARIRGLGIRRLDTRLASRLAVLSGGPRDLPARQRTLRELLDWSVNLLDPAEREVLAGLAVFPAGCSIEAAARIAGADDELLSSLVDHHLVQPLDVLGERRYRLLETVREYAYELLGGRRAAVEAELVSWVRDIVDVGDVDHRVASAQAAWLGQLDVELDNIREALRVAAADPDASDELGIAAAMWRYWWIRGHLAEGRSILDGIIERRGVVHTSEGVRVARANASLAWSMGDRERAMKLAQLAQDASTDIDDATERVHVLNLLGVMATGREDLEAAERYHLTALAIETANGLLEPEMTTRLNLGVTYLDAGRHDEARAMLQIVLEHRRGEGLSEGLGFVHINLGEIEFDSGNVAAAEPHFAAAVESFEAVGFNIRTANALQGLAAVEARTGRAESAARRLGVASSLLGGTGWDADGGQLAPVAADAARAALGNEEFERLFEEGAASGS
ncbi:MAG TPA: BTAD domain-containing putative transcriptional regulator [Candidatus Limnocylindrales bacterium]|nr:BTAD domain-containing putative transcriptional regulator [Candidatus Limnocylindrales bacterium]